MLEAGIRGKQNVTVTPENTAKTMGSGTLNVFATPALVALAEKTCWMSVADALDEGCGSVGTKLELEHTAPTPVGMTVTCHSELVAVEGRKLTFKEQRELQMLKDELEALPGKMAALEDEQHTLEDRLNDPGFFARDPDGFNATAKRISELDDEQTAALQRWEDVEFRIAELEGKAEDK